MAKQENIYKRISLDILEAFLEASTVLPLQQGDEDQAAPQQDCQTFTLTDGTLLKYFRSSKAIDVQRSPNPNRVRSYLRELDDFLANPPKIFMDYAIKNGDAKEKVKALVKKLGFEPLVMEERENNSSLLLDKLERLIYQADYGLVLLSADDELLDGGKFYTRPNVMIELGMLLAHQFYKEKKKHQRLTLINCDKDKLSIPTDILGLAFLDYSDQDFEKQLTKELVHLYPHTHQDN